MAIEESILSAANDIADALAGGRNTTRRANMAAYLEAAIWAAASSAEELPGNAWVDPKAVDSWIRSSAENIHERFPLPESLSDSQFRAIYKLLHKDSEVEALEKTIPTRIKLEPELESAIKGILGSAPSMTKPGISRPAPEAEKAPVAKSPIPAAPSAPAPALADKKPIEDEEEKKKAGPTPRPEPDRSNVMNGVDTEFDTSVTENSRLPGAPKR